MADAEWIFKTGPLEFANGLRLQHDDASRAMAKYVRDVESGKKEIPGLKVHLSLIYDEIILTNREEIKAPVNKPHEMLERLASYKIPDRMPTQEYLGLLQ